jgi:hypothetical protein
MKQFRTLILLSIVWYSCSTAQLSVEDEMFGYVIGVEGKSREDRSDFIKKQLTKLGVGFFTVPFEYYTYRVKDTLDLSGEDIVARIGGGQKRVVIGAHFDAWEGSPGANDNGGGVAVLLELVKSLKDQPLKCTIDFCFFDQEEKGLIGSQFYIQRVVDRKSHYGMINLDVEGTGDEVFVGPVGGGDDDFLMPLVRRTAKQTKFAYQERDFYPSSDHEAFANVRLENISISVVPKGDSELLSKMAKNGGRVDPKSMPKIMKVMHTADDRSILMTPEALKTSFLFTKTLVLLINDSIR